MPEDLTPEQVAASRQGAAVYTNMGTLNVTESAQPVERGNLERSQFDIGSEYDFSKNYDYEKVREENFNNQSKEILINSIPYVLGFIGVVIVLKLLSNITITIKKEK